MDNFEWRLAEYLDKNIRKYNLELVYKNIDTNWFQKISDKILKLNTGIAAPYKYWFKPKYVTQIREMIQQNKTKTEIEQYIQENSTDVNKLNEFLNFNNTTLQKIIDNHNIIENLKFQQQRDRLREIVNRRSVGKFRNDNIGISSSDIDNIKHIDVKPSDIQFTITDIDYLIKHFEDDYDLSPKSPDSPSTPITKRTIRDVNNNIPVYPKELRSMYLDFKRNKKFRDCIDDVLDIKDIDELNELLNERNTEKIVDLLRRISELGPHDYMRCMNHLDKEYCGSDIIHNYMQVIILIFNYFGANIDINSKSEIQLDDNEFIKNTLPYVRKIYGNIIINARKINTYNNCGPVDNKIIDRYDRIYKNLFNYKSCENTYALFNNYKLPGINKITEYATEHTIVFVIILIFISFIFSKFVSLMSIQPVVPVNKNILQ